MRSMKVNVSGHLDFQRQVCYTVARRRGEYRRQIQNSIFPADWFPEEPAEYILRWLVTREMLRGTRVKVDSAGREMIVMTNSRGQGSGVRPSRDWSRLARLERGLGVLLKLVERAQSRQLDQDEQKLVQLLDQGVGDLVRIAGGRRARRSGRGRLEGAPRAAKSSSTDEEK